MPAANKPIQDDHPDLSPLSLLARFYRFSGDIAGVFCLALSLMTLLVLLLPQLASGLLSWWGSVLRLWFGWGAGWLVLLLALAGIWLLRQKTAVREHFPWRRIFALELAAFTSLALLAHLGGGSLERAEAGLDGGRIGWGLAYLSGGVFQPLAEVGAVLHTLCLSLLLVAGAALGLGLGKPLQAWLRRKAEAAAQASQEGYEASPSVSVAPLQAEQDSEQTAAGRKRPVRLPAEFRKKFRLPTEDESAARPTNAPERDERLPALELLSNEAVARPDERNINLTAGLIEKTLAEFGIPAKVVGFRVGPTVTQFALEPGFVEKATNGDEANRHKVRVAQIASLSRDLSLALSAERLRIETPVPGRPYVGIEVPNAHSSVVRLRSILESETFYKTASSLAIALGRDVSGQPVVADLAAMPHLLIAGTTGSGKSVCIAAITTCLVMNNPPTDLRLVMIDPKMVELIRFNGLPHLYGKVETDLNRILGVLRWVVTEMDRRYRLLEISHSRNLDTFNRKARRRGAETLPRIVVLIDELADLMMSAPDQTEPALVRLAQMARATGIHLVVATQRPSTDVVTGLIKANFPARLSFAVASAVDSRVILDTSGAEALLGHGDMLYQSPEASAPLRSQGVMVSDQEVERVITFWQKSHSETEPQTPPWEEMLKQDAILGDHDRLIDDAIKIVRQTQRASASLLQRRLRIGYPRAARLIDELENLGVVSAATGSGRDREVLLEKEDAENEEIE